MAIPVAASPQGGKSDKPKKVSPAEAEAKDLLNEGTALTNIEAPGNPSFVMVADFKFTAAKKNYEGTETLQWSSPDLERSQFSIGSYTRVRVVAKTKTYLAQTSDHIPFPGQQWQSMLARLFSLNADDTENTKMKIVKKSSRDGPYDCTVSKSEYRTETVCFSPTDGSPTKFERLGSPRKEWWTFENYQSLGNKRFPSRITYRDGSGFLGQVNIAKLEVTSDFPKGVFDPPDNAASQDWCANPADVKPPGWDSANEAPIPILPFAIVTSGSPIRLSELSFTPVVIYVLVNTDGHAANAVMTYPEGSSKFGKYVVGIAYRNIYLIKSCEGKPIPYETMMYFSAPH